MPDLGVTGGLAGDVGGIGHECPSTNLCVEEGRSRKAADEAVRAVEEGREQLIPWETAKRELGSLSGVQSVVGVQPDHMERSIKEKAVDPAVFINAHRELVSALAGRINQLLVTAWQSRKTGMALSSIPGDGV